LEVARINDNCELYAVGHTVVYQGGHPPMPNPPWFRSDPSIEQPFNGKDVPLVGEGVRSVIEHNYPGRPKSKALALSPRRGQLPAFYTYFGLPEEAARRALVSCGDFAGVPCRIIAVDDVFVVPIPTMMKAFGFFQIDGNALIAPESREDVARRLAMTTGPSHTRACPLNKNLPRRGGSFMTVHSARGPKGKIKMQLWALRWDETKREFCGGPLSGGNRRPAGYLGQLLACLGGGAAPKSIDQTTYDLLTWAAKVPCRSPISERFRYASATCAQVSISLIWSLREQVRFSTDVQLLCRWEMQMCNSKTAAGDLTKVRNSELSPAPS
jgi:hypothetical protein